MELSLDNISALSELCTRDDPAYCSAVCPFEVDVNDIMRRIAKGDFTGAYRYFRSSVLFPKIISAVCHAPCRDACIRKKYDKPVDIPKLERAVCSHTKISYFDNPYIPAKTASVAVIGGGLGGLGCAAKLSRRGYQVTLYDKSDRLGGSLWNIDNSVLSTGEMQAELDTMLKENIKFNMGISITDLSEIAADAVYIATGGETKFDLQSSWNAKTLATGNTGIFMSSFSSSPVISLREGIRAADSIETFIKVGRMEGDAGVHLPLPTRLFASISGIQLKDPVLPADGTCYTEKEAMDEAARCFNCECRECMTDCEVLTEFGKQPKRIVSDVLATLQVVKAYSTRVASRQLNSCTLCRNCGDVCPQQLNFGDLFLKMRRKLCGDGVMPPAFHWFWLRDLEHSMSDWCFGAYPPEGKCQYLFFPGCRLGTSKTEYITETYEILRKNLGDVGIMLGCCGAPAFWAGNEKVFTDVSIKLRQHWEKLGNPKVIWACESCRRVLSESCPDWELVSLYDVLLKADVPLYQFGAQVISVFDPCAARDDVETKTAIRDLLAKNGFPRPLGGKNGSCCGFGGQTHAVNPKLVEKIIENRSASQLGVCIAYCANCRDNFAGKGKSVVHVLDLISSGANPERKPPNLTLRRQKREELKDYYEKYFGGVPMEHNDPGPEITISDELYNKMEQLLVLREDIRRTIAHCEETGEKVMDEKNNCIIGHLKEGAITFWVVYRPASVGFELINIYTHRMDIEEAVK